MAISIEEAKSFVETASRGARGQWLASAERSWAEIKRMGNMPSRATPYPNYPVLNRKARYPAWYSIMKIRQPLVLSRAGVPVGKDTSEEGNDNIGSTAALLRERLAINLAKDSEFFDVESCVRDDALATCTGFNRIYYECREVKERVKEYITPQKDEETDDLVFVDSNGQIVESDNICQDETGFYLELDKTVDVEEERILVAHILYKDILVDPDIRRWERCKRIAFRIIYSEREFAAIFGTRALLTIPKDSIDPSNEAADKVRNITVWEYWDAYEKDTKWFVDGGLEFIKPLKYLVPEEENLLCCNGLYDLDDFFPCPKPLSVNQPTDSFWPVTEYEQVADILDDIHNIFYRMFKATQAIRTRLIFDSSVPGLKAALSELAESDAIGVDNLSQALVNSGGSLESVVQYIPVDKMINGLNQLYVALEQRLQSLFKLTGTSDLLQGLTTTNTDKTLGERQMEEQYAINQLEEIQRKMQEHVRDTYQMMTEAALKNFKRESLDKYIMPSTLPEEHRANYSAALNLLKDHNKRFRIDLETDSTIAINEKYNKQMAIEFANVFTSGLEGVASIAKTQPGLVAAELHTLKYLIQNMRPGKLFQNEINKAIDEQIKVLENAPPPFNKDEATIKLEQQQLLMNGQLEMAKINAENARTQIDSYRAQGEMAIESQNLMLKSRDLALEERLKALEGQLSILYYKLDAQKAGVEISNKLADNQRLEQQTMIDAQRVMVEANQQPVQPVPQVVVLPSPPTPPAAPIIIAPPPAPAVAGPTIINAPNQPPQTSVIQPVQQVPVPMMPPQGLVF